MPACGLVNHGYVVSCCLIVLHPAAINKVKLPLSDKVPDHVFGIISLLPPPAREERLQREEKHESRPPSEMACWACPAAGFMLLQAVSIAHVCPGEPSTGGLELISKVQGWPLCSGSCCTNWLLGPTPGPQLCLTVQPQSRESEAHAKQSPCSNSHARKLAGDAARPPL